MLVPFQPNRYKVANVLEALKAIGHVAASRAAARLALDGVATRSGSTQARSSRSRTASSTRRRASCDRTPRSSSAQHVLPFAYDPDAPKPTRWLRFLDELWGDDEESKATLAEWFGYVLSGDTAQQKMFLLVGPKRSGKGTIARVLTGLLGAHNTAGADARRA